MLYITQHMAHTMPCKPGSACSICKHKMFCKGNSETQFIGRKSMKCCGLQSVQSVSMLNAWYQTVLGSGQL